MVFVGAAVPDTGAAHVYQVNASCEERCVQWAPALIAPKQLNNSGHSMEQTIWHTVKIHPHMGKPNRS